MWYDKPARKTVKVEVSLDNNGAPVIVHSGSVLVAPGNDSAISEVICKDIAAVWVKFAGKDTANDTVVIEVDL